MKCKGWSAGYADGQRILVRGISMIKNLVNLSKTIMKITRGREAHSVA